MLQELNNAQNLLVPVKVDPTNPTVQMNTVSEGGKNVLPTNGVYLMFSKNNATMLHLRR